MRPLKFLHTPLSGAPQNCFQSGPALDKAGPEQEHTYNLKAGPAPGILTWVTVTRVKWGHSRETTQARVGALLTLQ